MGTAPGKPGHPRKAEPGKDPKMKLTIENRTGAIQATVEDTDDGVEVTFWERAYRCQHYRQISKDTHYAPLHHILDKVEKLLWANHATPSCVLQGARR